MLAALPGASAASPGTIGTEANGLTMKSVNPEEDSLFILKMKARLDEVRRTFDRPTVALVLSGGGAKGPAQVGALKYVEELGIPVDMICGTSIGGLIGGLYAIGYDSDDLFGIFHSQNWSKILSDKIDQKYLPYAEKKYRGQFSLHIPFHYEDSTFNQRLKEQRIYSHGQSRTKFGDNNMSTKVGINSITSSLPSGYAYGLNVNNLLSNLTAGYQDSLDFTTLPIPFMCVSADIISGLEKNWSGGSLSMAMRSTMSIPGLFEPVRHEGMMLVDGGVRNNYPVDIARACGADFVIGIDLANEDPTYSQVNNIAEVISQFISMLGNISYEKHSAAADITIKPDVEGYGMLTFGDEAADTLFNRGYAAALKEKDALEKVKAAVISPIRSTSPVRKAVDIRTTSISIDSIVFDGLSALEEKYLMKKIRLSTKNRISAKDLDAAMSYMQATGAFETLSYSILGTEEPYMLQFNCQKGPIHRLGLGVHGDNEEAISLALNAGLNTGKLTGSKLDFSAKVGMNQKAALKYYLDLPGMPTINVRAMITNQNVNIVGENGFRQRAGFWGNEEEIYISNIKWRAVDLQAGVKNKYYSMRSMLSNGLDSLYVTPDIKLMRSDYLSAFLRGMVYTFDRNYYPESGLDVDFGYEFEFKRLGNDYITPFEPQHIVHLNITGVIPVCKRFVIIPELHYRSIFSKSGETHWDIANYIGGAFAGRHFGQQLPFIGFNDIQLAHNHILSVGADFRVNPWKELYTSIKAGAFKDMPTLNMQTWAQYPITIGAAVELGYATPVGPVKLNVHWNNRTGYGWYLGAGFDF